MSEHSATEQASVSRWSGWLSVAQRALGFGPLLVFAVYHLWVQWPALDGRPAWLARVKSHGLSAGLGALVLAFLLVHATLGVYRHRRRLETPEADDQSSPTQQARTRGRRSFQSWTGLTLVGFTIYHLTHVWPRPDGALMMWERSHDQLWALLGQPAVLAVYVLGCGALAGHAGHALATLLEPRLPERAQLALRLVAGLGALVLFALYLQVIGQYAAGEPMLPG